MYLKLLEWSNLGGITKDVKEGLKEPKRIKSKELQRPAKFCSPKEPLAKMALLCEIILQPKGTRCEIKGLLWKGPSSAKSFCSPIAPLYENFRSCETHLWHTSVISQPKPPFRSCETPCETIKALKTSISQPKPHFATTKPPMKPTFGTQVPFRNPTLSFRNCEMGCEMSCENGPWLRKWVFAAKCLLFCEKSQPSLGF